MNMTDIKSEQVKDQRRREFYIVDNYFQDEYAGRLGPITSAVYHCLLRYGSKTRIAWPAVRTIAGQCGVSERAVKEGLRRLKVWGLIDTRQQQAGKTKRFLRNVYILRDKKEWRAFNSAVDKGLGAGGCAEKSKSRGHMVPTEPGAYNDKDLSTSRGHMVPPNKDIIKIKTSEPEKHRNFSGSQINTKINTKEVNKGAQGPVRIGELMMGMMRGAVDQKNRVPEPAYAEASADRRGNQSIR